MPVLIPALDERCPAVLALEREGIPFILEIMKSDDHYSRFVGEHWKDDVIILEHDVVPWPGAINKLFACEHDWCAHLYPFAPNLQRWALGCTRFSARVVNANLDLPKLWQGTHWRELDRRIWEAVRTVAEEWPHLHDPPCAHVRGLPHYDNDEYLMAAYVQ